MDTHIHSDLLTILPKNQIKRVFHQDICDIDPEFLGFLHIYKALSEIIPKHWAIIDLGCAYNPQCFYFTEHKRYIAVDNDEVEKFKAPNCIIYEISIKDFVLYDLNDLFLQYDLNLKETFVILNYVPLKEEDHLLVKAIFKNLYVYYPSGPTNPLKHKIK